MTLRLRGRIDKPWRFFAIAIVLVIAGLFYADLRAFQESIDHADQARQLVRETNSVLSSVKDAETGERGYLLTGDRKYLAPYYTAVKALPGELAALNKTAVQTKRNISQVTRIQNLIKEKLAEINLAVQAREHESPEAALAIVTSDEGRLTMDEVRAACALLTSTETVSLYEGTRIAEMHANRSRVVVLFGCMCLVVLLFRLGSATDQVVREREEFAANVEEARQLLQATLTSISDAVIVTDAGGSVRFMNPVAETLTGWTTAEAVHRYLDDVLKIVNEKTREPAVSLFKAVQSSGKTVRIQERTVMLSRTGSEIPLEESSAPIRNRYGQLLGAILVFRDVTDRRAAERELERWKEIFSGAGFGMFVVDPATRSIVDMNPTFAAMHGYSVSELLGVKLDTLETPESREALYDAMSLASRNGRHMFEHRHVRRDGSEFSSLIDLTTFREAGKEYQAGYCSDITEKTKFEDALRESEERFRTLASALPQLVWSASQNGRTEYINQVWISYAGWSGSVLPEDLWSDFVHRDDLAGHVQKWKYSFASGKVFESQARLRSHDGTYRWFLCRGVPVRDRAGKIVRWLGGCTDVQEQMENAARLRHTNQALQRSNADLEQFAYAASHDLQEPLRMVSIYSELLKQEYGTILDQRAASYLDFAANGAQRMSTLLKGLLTYARLTDDASEEPKMADGNAAVAAALLNLESTINEVQAEVICGRLPCVALPGIHLVQLFQNLIGNALKYRKNSYPDGENPTVRIEAVRDGDNRWIFSVRDNGIGIEPEYLGQIFGLFKRLHGQSFEGTGIGLALCQKIVERAGGKIWAESEINKGSALFFVLPAADITS